VPVALSQNNGGAEQENEGNGNLFLHESTPWIIIQNAGLASADHICTSNLAG
jgi:uncharacterized Fe-S cluster protein YjdI